MDDYPITVTPLAPEDGGGYLAAAPGLPACMSDGETPEDAAANCRKAIVEWIEQARSTGRTIPPPGEKVALA